MMWTKNQPHKPGKYFASRIRRPKRKGRHTVREVVHVAVFLDGKAAEFKARLPDQRVVNLSHFPVWWSKEVEVPEPPELSFFTLERKEDVKSGDRRFPVVVQEWTEHECEPGWGVSIRPDGYTMHLTEADRRLFIESLAEKQVDGKTVIENYSCYSSADGPPKVLDIEEATYRKLLDARKKGKYGLWGEGKSVPRSKSPIIEGTA